MNAKSTATSWAPAAAWLAPENGAGDTLGGRYLLLVTLLAAVLRCYRLTGQSLWVDEIMSWAMMRPDAGLNFLEQIRDAIQGPLYLAVTWPLLRLQDSALMLRLPSAVAGILTVPLFALTVGRLFDGRSGRLAGLLLALSPFHLWYSQEGRGYALLMFFAVAMGWLLLRMTRHGSGPGSALLFALCSAGAVWSNMSGLFLWAAMGLGVLIFQRPATPRQWGWWAAAFAGGALAVAPWLLKAAGIWAVDRLAVGAATGEALRGETTFTPFALPYTLFTFFYGYSLGPSLRELHLLDKAAAVLAAWPLLAAAVLPVGAGLIRGLAGLRKRDGALLLWIALPLLVLVLLAVRNVKPWNPRYVAVALPWLLALAACGLVRLPRTVGAALTLLLTGLTLFSLGNYYGNGRYAKADVRAMAAQVDRFGTDDPILAPSVGNVFSYYHHGPGEVLGAYGLPPLRSAADAERVLDETLPGRPRLFFVEARQWFFDPGGVLPGALARRGHLRLESEAPGAKLYSWRAPAAPEAAHEQR